MRKNKILFLSIVLIAIVAIIQCNEVKAENLEDQYKYNDTYIVPFGKEIDLPSNGEYKSDNEKIATIGSDNKIRVCGVGYFTITGVENNETLNFFSWNAFLTKGKYFTYKDEKKKSKSDILYSKAYLAVTETNNKDAFKIVDHLLAGGTYKRETELNGRYITSDYNSKTGKSDTKYFEYSFEKKFSKIMPTAIELDKTNITLKLGENEKLNVIKIEPKDVEDNTVIFESDNTNIVEVKKETGEISGVGVGTAIITATAKTNNENKEITAKCEVEVVREEGQEFDVEKLELEEESINLITGEEKTLKATVSPIYADNKKIEWESNDRDIVTVESDGKIKALNKGEAVITAKAHNGIKQTCKVTVKDEKLEIHFINSGSRVDAIYMRAGDKSLFIDGGFKKDAASEIKYLDTLGVTKIDYYIASHSHKNHVGAGPAIINKYNIMKVVVGREKSGDTEASWKAIQKHAKDQKIDISGREKIVMDVGDILEVGNIKITCIGPYKESDGHGIDSETQNRNSLMLRFDYRNTSMLACGDNTKEVNFEHADANLMKVNILKNSHHNQNNTKLYNLSKPQYTVFPTGDEKSLESKTIKTLTNLGSKIYQISKKKDNNVLFISDGNNITVTTGKGMLTSQKQEQAGDSNSKEVINSDNNESELQKEITALQDDIKQLREEMDKIKIEIDKLDDVLEKLLASENSDLNEMKPYSVLKSQYEDDYKEITKQYCEKVIELFQKNYELSKNNKEDKKASNSNEKLIVQNSSKTADNEKVQAQETTIDLQIKLWNLEDDEEKLFKKLEEFDETLIYNQDERDKLKAQQEEKKREIKEIKEQIEQKKKKMTISELEKEIEELERYTGFDVLILKNEDEDLIKQRKELVSKAIDKVKNNDKIKPVIEKISEATNPVKDTVEKVTTTITNTIKNVFNTLFTKK